MRQGKADLFLALGKTDALCITTNGFVKRNGEAVMGRGCAKEAAKRWPKLPAILGSKLKSQGNKVTGLIKVSGTYVLAFPVKPQSVTFDGTNAVKHMCSKLTVGNSVPGWACLADIAIIERSARELVALADAQGWKKVALPRPGCGAGELSWEIVEPILAGILDDRFICVTF